MSWAYRIVDLGEIDHEVDGERGSDHAHELREVHFDGDRPVAIADTAADFAHWSSYGDDPRQSIIWGLERALEAARTAPIVIMADVVK